MGDVPIRRPRRAAIPRRPTPDRDREAYREAKRFYNAGAWKRLRRAHLLANPCCVACTAEGLGPRPGSHVDHVIDRADRPDLALDAGNLQTLCASHHSAKTLRTRGPNRLV